LLRLRASSTHAWVKLEGADRVSQALSITLFSIFSKCLHYPKNTSVQKGHINNEVGTYIESTYRTTKCTYANMKQHDIT
ncbi:hypothetical protein B296_00009379, partial [Ensete ventricosum]